MAINLNVNMTINVLLLQLQATSLPRLARRISKVCPTSSNPICKDYYYPVKCGDCEYDNQCLATEASSKFTDKTCRQLCPENSNDEACPDVFDPVLCGQNLRCDYSNQCVATAASSFFTAERCIKFCPKVSDLLNCEGADSYDPVKCGVCEYDNLCLASAALDHDQFNPKSCEKICPKSSGDTVCIAEHDPVKCGKDLRCEYDNLCLATAASSYFTAETCKKSCKTTGNNIFIHEPCENICEDSRSYRFKLGNGKERKCAYITKRDTKTRQDMYCKGETAKECCKSCKRQQCDDKREFKFKIKNGKSVDCSFFKKGKKRGRRRSKYCKGKVKRKCCESCTYEKDYVSDIK